MSADGGRRPSTALAILFSRCPRCGRGSLYAGYLRQAEACTHCGLDYSGLKVDDGPAAFAVFIVGFLAAGGALLVEVAYHPPYWLHALIWIPFIFLVTLGVLRPLKSWLVVAQYAHDAREERFE